VSLYFETKKGPRAEKLLGNPAVSHAFLWRLTVVHPTCRILLKKSSLLTCNTILEILVLKLSYRWQGNAVLVTNFKEIYDLLFNLDKSLALSDGDTILFSVAKLSYNASCTRRENEFHISAVAVTAFCYTIELPALLFRKWEWICVWYWSYVSRNTYNGIHIL
jgi:hypothetical protein